MKAAVLSTGDASHQQISNGIEIQTKALKSSMLVFSLNIDILKKMRRDYMPLAMIGKGAETVIDKPTIERTADIGKLIAKILLDIKTFGLAGHLEDLHELLKKSVNVEESLKYIPGILRAVWASRFIEEEYKEPLLNYFAEGLEESLQLEKQTYGCFDQLNPDWRSQIGVP